MFHATFRTTFRVTFRATFRATFLATFRATFLGEASCDVVYVSYDVSLEDSGDDSRGILNDAVNGAHSIARPTDAWSVNKCSLRCDPVYASTTRVSAVLVCAGRTACVVH